MGLAKPTGGYAEQMLDPGGWPEVDEQAFYDRAQQYTQVLRQVTDVLEACQSQRAEIFETGSWSGGAADAANTQLGTLIDALVTLQNGLATVITWHKYVAQTIVAAKSDITDNVVEAHRTIATLEKDTSLDDAERTQQINTVVTATHGANVSIVDGTAAQILVSKSWKPPANALQDLLDQKTPPPVNIPSGPVAPPSPGPRPMPAPPPVTPGGGGLKPPVTPGGGGLTPPTPGGGGLPPLTPPLDGGGLQPSPGPSPLGPRPTPPSPAVPGGGPPAPLGPAAPAVPLSPAAGLPQPGAGLAGGPKGVTPAAASGPGVMPASVTPGEESAAAHAGGTGVPTGAMGAGGAGGSGGSSGGSGGPGGRSAAPAGEKSGDKSASARPAASSRSTNKSKPRAQPMYPDRADIAEAVVSTVAMIPVSAARLERDARADAAKADAARRAGPDALQLARRIGAALNAPDSPGGTDLGFFWVTGVTAEGAIVVANSYGLAYIPDGVELPEKVYLASADQAISAGERARWATYPVMAVQGWAAHHEMELRAIIGTEAQLANSDAGVPTIFLQPDDIPDTGDMIGRPRLAVVDSEAAERLAATPDTRLADLLPEAPAGAEPAPEPAPEPQAELRPEPADVVDPEAAAVLVAPGPGPVRMGELLAQMPLPPADADAPAAGAPSDDRFMLWFEVMKPMASDASGRQAAHLQAFQAYAAHAEEVLLREAHTTIDPEDQRSAVADWMYWKCVAELLNTAPAEAPVLAPA
ncbi:hypothetical protein [Mycobacterium sp. Aquia_213]|uniref:hypothetical protein n=1 Tax=Mycobacterium sp. Aquia_213 TaxID=2991728 RepID=UPI0022719BAC|nr:hypothetical protein [Mycobacterium sp. Aquia_213]WAC91699.1 hypothetical protein LMQ14_00240 [Mycobacterium sp. Aquia_213]